MNDDHINAFKGFIGAAIIGCILWILIAWAIVGLYFHFWHVCPTIRANNDYLADRWTVERHKYHGIGISTFNPETGEAYYTRDGKRCKL